MDALWTLYGRGVYDDSQFTLACTNTACLTPYAIGALLYEEHPACENMHKTHLDAASKLAALLEELLSAPLDISSSSKARIYMEYREAIRKLRAEGLTFPQISQRLAASGVDISPDTLRIYASRYKSPPSSRPTAAPNPACSTPLFTKRRIVENLAASVLEAKNLGLSWEAIASQLRASGFSIQARTLRAYVNKARKA